MEVWKMRSNEPRDNKADSSEEIQEIIKKLLQNPPKYVFPVAKKRELLDRIYSLESAE